MTELTHDELPQEQPEAAPTENQAPRHKPDHDQLAVRLAAEWREKARFFWGDWYVYQDGVWQRRAPAHVNVACRQFLRQERANGADITISAGMVTAVVALAADDCFVDDETIDQGDGYINLKNGILNLATFQLESHRPGLYLTNQLDFDFDDGAGCPTWHQFLQTSLVQPGTRATDWDLIGLLQEALGYSLTADTSHKAAFWLVGKPDSGKSTLISFIRGLLGNLHATVDLNQLASNRFMLAEIAGKRAVTFTEARVNSVLPDDIFKSIVGGTDEIYADVKNKPGITFVPKAKFWWAMNDVPRVTDRSGAVYNRLYAIPFNRTIPQTERITNLADQLAHERAGVFAWALAGYMRLTRRGHFIPVQQAEDFKDAYRLSNDTEQTFVNECCETGDIDYRTQAQDLYRAYREWCKDNGFTPKNANQTAREWERLGFVRGAAHGRRFWRKVRLLSEVSEV
jgi:putative DNA primase/helicase